MLTSYRDLQTILGMTWPLPVTMYSTGGSPPFTPDQLTPSNTNEPYLAFLLDLRNRKTQDIPKTISISYGDSEQTVPLSYAQSVCNQFAALGAMGVSFLVASGDFGVGKTGKCISVSLSPILTFGSGAHLRSKLSVLPRLPAVEELSCTCAS
jgi:tripeptidyl-peptidase I